MMSTSAGADGIDDQRLELLRRRLSERGLRSAHASGATPAISDGQRRMWFVHSMDTTGSLLNVCVSYRLTGDVDVVRLHAALDAVVARHAVLRTTYHADGEGEPYLVVHPALKPGWAEHDLAELTPHARRLRLEVIAQREFGVAFDLTSDAPLRVTVARTGPAEHVLLLVAHHIAWDDASWRPFFDDLTHAYAGELPGPTPVHAPAPVHPNSLGYWRELLTDPPEPLELPGSHGSVVPVTWRAQRCTVQMDGGIAGAVTELARATGATPYMVLLAAYSALLLRYTDTRDFLVAVPVLNSGAGDEIGYHGNTVAVRMRPHHRQSFRDLVCEARDAALGAFAHQDINLDQVVRELNPDRRHGVERMARVGFGFREPDGAGFCPPGVRCERADLRGHFAQLPLGVMVEQNAGDDGASLIEAEFLVEVLDQELVRQFLDHFVVLLGDALADPERPLADLTLMSADDAAKIFEAARGERFEAPAGTLGAVVAQQAARTPDAVAVVYEGRSHTYREINEQANRFAHWLIGQGIGTEDCVGVVLEKSPDLVIAALGIVKAGAVYLPVDPEYPEERVAHILNDADPKLVVRAPIADLAELRADDPRPEDLVRPLGADNLAYLIYTSGSTGKPKGVPVPHAPVVEYFAWFGEEYRIGPTDRLLQVASPSFDVSIGEIFGTLSRGARLVIPRPGGLRDIGYLTELLRSEAITSMHFVPSLLGLFLSLPGVSQWRSLRRVPIGGEALPGELADNFHATFDALLHNFYGPTETVINATRYKVEGRQGTRIVPIGTPKINTDVHVLDDSLQPVPVGVIGEIYIGGTHLARGYHGKPALTAERFVADPFTPGGRLYRTGDVARRSATGDVEFVGRADEQVKIRGFRIELGEVSAAITVDPTVGQAVVVADDLPHLGKTLIAYLTSAAGEMADVDRVKVRVAAALPDYMTPAAYVVVDEIPVTANGKLDRAALPPPQIETGTDYRAPETDTERAVAELFGRLLGRSDIGCDDTFFELGGHSLLATKLVAAIRSECGVDVDIRQVFELGTVARLSDLIDRSRAGDLPNSRPKLVPITSSISDDRPRSLSASQLRSWFQYRIDGPSPVNNIPFAAELCGPCDEAALIAAVGDIVARHDILHTVYHEIGGVPYQVVEPVAEVAVRCAAGDGERWLRDQLDDERRHCFDLQRQWPIRVALLTIPGRRVLSVVVHHIAADHWSAGVLYDDLLVAYRARSRGDRPAWSPLAVQYADYAAWQGDLLADGDESPLQAQRDYWKVQLADLPEDTGMHPDYPRPALSSGAGDSVPLRIDAGTRGRLAALSAEVGVTEFMLLQTAVAVVLHKAGGGSDIPLGTPVSGRVDTELDRLVGFFVNFLVLRNDLSGNPTLREALQRTRETALSAYSHQELPFDRVVDLVNPVRTLSRNPLFQTVVHVREQLPSERIVDSTADGDTVFTALEPTFDIAQADLSVNLYAGPDSYTGSVIYRTDLYQRSTVERFAGWLHRVIDTFATDADTAVHDVRLTDDSERREIVTRWSVGADAHGGPRTVPELLAPSRDFGADRIAVRCGGGELTFEELHRRSDGLAQLLARNGIGPGSLVGMCMRRDLDLIVAMVAIAKAGAAILPLDPSYPAARLQFLLHDVEPKVVVITAEAERSIPVIDGIRLISLDDPAVRAELNAEIGAVPVALRPPHPDDPMYLVFTSGSTGRPKGVLGTHRATSARVDWQLNDYQPLVGVNGGNDIRLAQSSITFIDGIVEVFAAVAAGATMILADDAEQRDTDALAELMLRHSVTQLSAVASLVSVLADTAPEVVGSLTRLVCSGEPVTPSLLQRLVALPETVELVNSIGATETAGGVVRGRLRAPTPKLGRATAGSRVYVLDDDLSPVPVGVIGELYFAGEQLALGYWKSPQLTATRFIPDPFGPEPGGRLYRSGDRGRWTEDGTLEFVGRTDHQVNIRGFRVELGEVEAALKSVDGVAVAAARTWEGPGGAVLAGYVGATEPVSDPAAFAFEVRAALWATLPAHLVPATITVLDTIPKTESGKLNRPALPPPAVHTTGSAAPPATATERTLATAIATLLGVADIGRGDDFFAIGGDSILSVQLAARVRDAGLTIEPRMVFEHPTLEQLAAAIDAEGISTDAGPVSGDIRREPMSVSGLSADELRSLTSAWGASRAESAPGAGGS